MKIEAQLTGEQIRTAIIEYLERQGWYRSERDIPLEDAVRIDSHYPAKDSGLAGPQYQARVFVEKRE
jgi:hypothetical protein